ncbi:glutaryl-CoA dehydrogenase [Nocardioides exalbidus]|uniref:Glutaryl-CoA dehydrogenase n=1 Tax=Nocardioides exalbidus TaxID=402596 RepID=A0A1H4M5F1_9ACTN|nr:acyl-CoA dehydrogenase family protein [Nocardioides exalbidus]SEB78249.1 glutaryl-CoA dehydrogenase [Nocardioides exalbidus]
MSTLDDVGLTDSPFSDFLGFELLLDEEDRELLSRVRAFTTREIEPIINDYWTRAEFPHQLVEGLAELGIAGLAYDGPGCPNRGALVDGMVAMELGRIDPSIATFMGVHGGLAMGSINLCGSDEQRERWLPAMARMELIGAFGLTEPDVGSAISAGLATSARRDGDDWILNGEKKWIGNAAFADLVVIWARDEADGQVKGFVVEKDTNGMTFDKQEDKIALRVVQNAEIHLHDVRVPEANRLQKAESFRSTADVLRVTRMGVAWQAAGCARGAFEHALRYTKAREQFGRPIASFQLVQDLLVKMLGNVTASTAMNVRASQLQDAGLLRDEHASLCKVHATVRMREAVGWAREVLGGNGILLEHHVGRFVADAEAIYSYEGTREINTLIVGRAITGESAFV